MKLNKKVGLFLAALLALPSVVSAETLTERLIGLGMSPSIAEQIGSGPVTDMGAADGTLTLTEGDSVSIGVTTQEDDEALWIKRADDGVGVGDTTQASLILEDDGQHYISLRNPNGSWQGVQWNEGTTAQGGYIQHYYDGSAGHMQIGIGGAAQMALEEGGKIALGASALADSNEQLYIKQADDGVAVSGIGERGTIFESSVGGFHQFRSANSTANGLMFNGGTDADHGKFFYIFDGSNGTFQFRIDGGQRYVMDVDSFQPASNGGSNLGTSTLSWNQVFLYSPDGSVSQCGVDNADSFSCSGL